MCGRYTLVDTKDLEQRYPFTKPTFTIEPNYNVTPGQSLPVIKEDGQFDLMKWGIVPFWSSHSTGHYAMINAKAETLLEKVTYKDLIASQRCLIPATGFYEWKQDDKIKTPYYIKFSKILSFAGLYSIVVGAGDYPIKSFTIITTDANSLLAKIHDRMPVILSDKAEATWLDPKITDPKVLLPLLKPYQGKELAMYKVSPLVNNPRNNTVDLIKPLGR